MVFIRFIQEFGPYAERNEKFLKDVKQRSDMARLRRFERPHCRVGTGFGVQQTGWRECRCQAGSRDPRWQGHHEHMACEWRTGTFCGRTGEEGRPAPSRRGAPPGQPCEVASQPPPTLWPGVLEEGMTQTTVGKQPCRAAGEPQRFRNDDDDGNGENGTFKKYDGERGWVALRVSWATRLWDSDYLLPTSTLSWPLASTLLVLFQS